jgi:hypothetical protein
VAAGRWLFVTDGGSRVVSFDLSTAPPTLISDVSTSPGDPFRADELAYAPGPGMLLVINNADSPPFGTLIAVEKATGKLTVGARITFDAAHGVDARNGAEQPVWDARTGRFYLSIPQIGPVPQNGGVVRIDPNTASVEAAYPVEFCGPAGLARGPHRDLLIGCNTVFDAHGNVWDPNGTVSAAPKDVILNIETGETSDVPGVGAGDEVTFNPGDGRYYATGSGSPLRPLPAATAKGSTPLGVIDAKKRQLLQLVPTYNVPAGTGHPAGTSHSIAAYEGNNHVFVPLPANNAIGDCLTGCIGVYGTSRDDAD